MEVIGYPCQLIQSDNLNGETEGKPNVCATANNSGADILYLFIVIVQLMLVQKEQKH